MFEEYLDAEGHSINPGIYKHTHYDIFYRVGSNKHGFTLTSSGHPGIPPTFLTPQLAKNIYPLSKEDARSKLEGLRATVSFLEETSAGEEQIVEEPTRVSIIGGLGSLSVVST
jgi:hypothetical protein